MGLLFSSRPGASPRGNGTRARRGLVLAAAVGATAVFAPGAFATDITSSGPLTDIGISADLNCSVNHTGDTSGEFYGDTACGTLIAAGGTLYRPASIPAGGSAQPFTAWNPVSQSGVTGAGTAGNPYQVTTVVNTGGASPALTVTEVDSYVVGQESYRTDVTIHNNTGSATPLVVYRAGDCYLQNSDVGYGRVDGAAVSCRAVNDDGSPGDRIEQFAPITGGSSYFESHYSTVWSHIGTQQPFPNTCDCDVAQDNGAGLSWSPTVPAGGDVTISSIITFSPLGNLPLTTTKTADASSAQAGAADGYTITISNPNDTAVSLSSITDELPAGFTYTAGSTTGATTSDPSISGSDLTWSGPFSVSAGGSVSLHFGVTVALTADTYFNQAGGSADPFTVTPTGPTAPVTVTAGGGPQPITTAKTADGGTAEPGASDGYTITFSNPNDSAITLDTITDHLPAGFSYTAGSSSGATTADPSVSGQDLTWSGAFTVPAHGTLSEHFNVTVSSEPGTYYNDAGGSSSADAVNGVAHTAPVTVVGGGENPLTVTKTPSATRVHRGDHVQYTITIANPNDEDVTLSLIRDALPSGFHYVAGSSSGITSADPHVDQRNGKALKWSGSFVVPAHGSITLTFDTTAGGFYGVHTDRARVTFPQAVGGFTFVRTGKTAGVRVVRGATATV
jgi:uncharacterized repeat protein (TIGR01451 family)